MIPVRSGLVALVALLVAVSIARAQAVVVEIEPNATKAEAQLVPCMLAGDVLTGVTTGAAIGPGNPGPGSADTYLVTTCPLPPGIYRHRLTITTSGPIGHFGLLLGLDVLPPTQTISAGETILQASSTMSTPPRFVQWYGFGRAERVYFRIQGTAATLAPYTVTLTTDVVQPSVVPGLLHAGSIWITTEGQGHTTDTELQVYDANLVPIPDFKNDDTPAGLPGGAVGFESTLVRNYALGTYYLLVARFNLCDDQVTGFDDGYLGGDVLDFPDALLSSSTTSGSDASFTITDNSGTIPMVAMLPNSPFEVLWYEIQVGPASGTISTYCFGDGSGAICPCANIAGLGNGCPNSVNPAGAHLAGVGQAGVSADSFTLVGTGMPDNFSLYFQGSSALTQPFGDGLRCTGGSSWRLGDEFNAQGGSQYPSGLDLPIGLVGQCLPGQTRYYQAWYRNSAVYCTVSTFNLTNGVIAIWGP